MASEGMFKSWCEACGCTHNTLTQGSYDLGGMWIPAEESKDANQFKVSPTGGLKGDGSKLRMDLIDPYAMEGLAEVLTAGAKKYGDRNWEKGIEWSRIFGAILRHLNAIQKGEDTDPESGKLHADHLMTNAMFLSRFMRTHRHLDDRVKAESALTSPSPAPPVYGISQAAGTGVLSGLGPAQSAIPNVGPINSAYPTKKAPEEGPFFGGINTSVGSSIAPQAAGTSPTTSSFPE